MLLPQDLDRNIATQLRVTRQVHSTDTALADLAADVVARIESGQNVGGNGLHLGILHSAQPNRR